MRNASVLRIWVIGSLALALQAGCATDKDTRVETLPPASEELPRLAGVRRMLPVAVGVQGGDRQPRVLLVPSMDPIPLTPKEKAALEAERGEKENVELLRLYHPESGIKEGVSPLPAEASVGRGGRSGTLVGWSAVASVSGVSGAGVGGVETSKYGPVSRSFGLSRLAPPVGGIGPEASVNVGENPRRSAAAHYDQRTP